MALLHRAISGQAKENRRATNWVYNWEQARVDQQKCTDEAVRGLCHAGPNYADRRRESTIQQRPERSVMHVLQPGDAQNQRENSQWDANSAILPKRNPNAVPIRTLDDDQVCDRAEDREVAGKGARHRQG